MLSYLHAYHAGNHADVLKHVVLLALLAQLTAKPKPLRYIETHAGAGHYDLTSAAALKNREFDSGIARVLRAAQVAPGAQPVPLAVQRLLDHVAAANAGTTGLYRYPGSPALAAHALRPIDRLYLFELHPAEQRRLAANFERDKRVEVRHEDGLAGSIGLVPPPERRGLVFIDPSYEMAYEPEGVADAVAKAHRRFATGVIAIWYPVITRASVKRLHALLARAVSGADVFELCVLRDGARRSLTGSGVVVVNPPWGFRAELDAALPWLTNALAEAPSQGSYRNGVIGRAAASADADQDKV